MRFANPSLVIGGLDKLVAVVACAGFSLKDKLKAERPEKGLGSYSVRSAPKPALTAGTPGTPAPCPMSAKTPPVCPEEKGGNPCNTKTPPEAKTKTCGAPKENRAAPAADFECRSPVQDQLNEFKRCKTAITYITTSAGAAVGSKTASLTVGQRGTMLLQDFVYLDEMAHFNRERIPERVVHAKGAGAFGQFEVTHDITKYCKAGVFKVGKKTPVAVRFSGFGGEKGTADTTRDLIGFAIKFYTEEGNWDLVGSHLPAFFLRDPIHDADMFWDFIALRPETTHAVLHMFSDRGLPDGYRHMHGYGNHTFKMVNKDGCVYYAKFHIKTNQGIRNISPEEATCISGNDPDFAVRDLYNAIGRKEFPCWSIYAQIISEEDARMAKDWNPFDPTKVWPHEISRLVPIGKLILNRNPKNYFSEVEQLAFSPAHMVPGIEPSPDKVLQGRLFAYSDAHRYRVGTNYHQIPVNCPYKAKASNYQRDGPMCVDCNQDGAPNYYPNYFNGPMDSCKFMETPMCVFGEVARYETIDDDNYTQAAAFYQNVLTPDEQNRLAENIGNSLRDAQSYIQYRVLENLSNVDPDLVEKIKIVIGMSEPMDDEGYGMNDNNNRKK
ncbi:hypothetical protein BsWGS_12893 [Bradybaena similaris]